MYEARSVFSEIQLQCFYISGRLITQDEFISLINNKNACLWLWKTKRIN